jgi:hypothetical protein
MLLESNGRKKKRIAEVLNDRDEKVGNMIDGYNI